MPLLLLGALAPIACSDPQGVVQTEATLRFTASAPPYVASIVIEIRGTGIDSPLVFNLPVQNGIASDDLTVPAGTSRQVTAKAFDVGGTMTHRADTTVAIVGGTNPTVAMTLLPMIGDTPIVVTFGSVTISLTGTDTSLRVGDSLKFVATIVGVGGPIPGAVARWGSTNPAVASVGPDGWVQARAPGSALIVATFGGAAAARAIAVPDTGGWDSLGVSLQNGVYVSGFVAVGGSLVAFGAITGPCQPYTATYTATVGSGGVLGTWMAQANYVRSGSVGATVVVGNALYAVAGHDGCSWYHNTVATGNVAANGSIGGWVTLGAFPRMQTSHGLVATNNFVYALGGLAGNCPVAPLANATFATIDGSGSIGTWLETTAMPGPRDRPGAVATAGGRVFVLGGMTTGCDSSTSTNTIFVAQQNGDGTLSAWSAAGTLPARGWFATNTAFLLDTGTVIVAFHAAGETTAKLYRGTITGSTIGGWQLLGTLPREAMVLALSGDYLFALSNLGDASVYRRRVR